MPINASPHYLKAEQEYHQAQTTQQKIAALKKMISLAPGHKGAENLRKDLKRRLARLKYVGEKEARKAGGKKGIRKEGFQVVLLGRPNSGKSELMKKLTNAEPKASGVPFTTKEPVIGMMHFQGVQAQIIDLPSWGSKDFDFSVLHSADAALLTINKLEDLAELEEARQRIHGKEIIVLNKADTFSPEERRKMEARIKSKRMDAVIISALQGKGIEELENRIIDVMGVIRVFMKEPGKEASDKPAVLPEGSTIKDVAESIYKGFSRQVKEARLTGPSGKFSNQRVGMKHVCKDRDVVEFKT